MRITLKTAESDKIKTGQTKLDKMSNFVMSNAGMMLDNKYEIKREIARGGMGIVYEAYHKYTHQRVAIKVILATQLTLKTIKRFQKELEAYSLLSHPNVITIHDAGVYNNYSYIVMEYIDGVDICTYVKQQEKKNKQEDAKRGTSKGRDWKLCARLIYETALGLDYIHSKKMIHRDIKPANILVRPNGSPVIIDLGLVKFNRTQSYNLTRSKEIIGTFEYMPIEQTRGKKGKIDARTDVYSLGLVLYELLTGKKAYNGETIMELCYKIMLYYPPLPREINVQIPEVLEEITIHAIEKQKTKRYASMKEFADALKKYLDDTTIKPTPQYAKMKHRLWLEKNKNKIIASCISGFLVIGLIIILSTSWQTERKKNILPFNISQPTELRNDEKIQFYKNISIKMIEWVEQSAKKGDSKSQCELGSIYEEDEINQDYDKAVYWYEQSANQDYAEAQYKLGNMYFNGKGIKQDFAKARELWEKSANQEYAQAQFSLGFMYYKGQGVKQDYKKSFYWWEKLAKKGNAKVQCELGLMYANGQGVTQNFAKAREWFEKSAKQGNVQAQQKLKELDQKK